MINVIEMRGGERGFWGCEDKHNHVSASADQERRLHGEMTRDMLRYNQMGGEIGGGEQEQEGGGRAQGKE